MCRRFWPLVPNKTKDPFIWKSKQEIIETKNLGRTRKGLEKTKSKDKWLKKNWDDLKELKIKKY